MPVRSLGSSVLVWPNRTAVDAAVRAWAAHVVALQPDVLRLGYFGSYARGDWGSGSDVDLVAVVRFSDLPFEERARRWDLASLPVPAEILVYTEAEWRRFVGEGSRFARTLESETRWVYPNGPNG